MNGVAAGAAAHDQLVEIGRSALRAIMDVMPQAVWRGFKRGFGGFFLLGFAGLAITGAVALANGLGLVSLPTWLVLVQLGWVPLVLALAGAYVGGVDGFLSALSEEVEQRGLAIWLFALVKPVCTRVVRRLASSPSNDMAAELRQAIDSHLSESEVERARTVGERLERFLAMRSRRILCLAALRGPRHELESLGVERVQHMLVETIEDLFSMQACLAAVAALLASVAPAVFYVISSAVSGG